MIGAAAPAAPGSTRSRRRSRSSVRGPIPRTRASSSSEANAPCASRESTMRRARLGPMPGSSSRSVAVARLRSIDRPSRNAASAPGVAGVRVESCRVRGVGADAPSPPSAASNASSAGAWVRSRRARCPSAHSASAATSALSTATDSRVNTPAVVGSRACELRHSGSGQGFACGLACAGPLDFAGGGWPSVAGASGFAPSPLAAGAGFAPIGAPYSALSLRPSLSSRFCST